LPINIFHYSMFCFVWASPWKIWKWGRLRGRNKTHQGIGKNIKMGTPGGTNGEMSKEPIGRWGNGGSWAKNQWGQWEQWLWRTCRVPPLPDRGKRDKVLRPSSHYQWSHFLDLNRLFLSVFAFSFAYCSQSIFTYIIYYIYTLYMYVFICIFTHISFLSEHENSEEMCFLTKKIEPFCVFWWTKNSKETYVLAQKVVYPHRRY